ncbi:MAG: hypothetical protein ABI333_04775 [bacterium]
MKARSDIHNDSSYRLAGRVPPAGRIRLFTAVWLSLALLPLVGCGLEEAVGSDSESDSLGRNKQGESTVYTQAVPVADPYRAKLPNDSSLHNFARSIWDMHAFDGRIFMGAGDFMANSGPTDVWTYREVNGQAALEVELTVDDEAVTMIHEADGLLMIPGIDSTESWDLGNIYVRASSAWTKHRTVPNGVHVYDMARYQGNYYVHRGDGHKYQTLESTDGGQTWRKISSQAGRMMGLDSHLVIMTNGKRGSVFLYDGTRVSKMSGPAFPDSPRSHNVVTRMVRYHDGVLYTSGRQNQPESSSALFFLNDFDAGPMTIVDFGTGGDQAVQDVLVRGDTVYVLAVSTELTATGQYRGIIVASEDLTNWRPTADFVVPAPPFSVELLDGVFYVGLGAEGWFHDTVSAASGSIWRLE